MTFLNLINNVLRRLREEEAVSVTETDYIQMVGDFVNDAKRIVEDSYQWEALREEFEFLTAATNDLYSLTNTGNRAKILSVYDKAQKCELEQKSLKDIRYYKLGATDTAGTPRYFAYKGLDVNTDTQVCLYPVPEDIRTVNVLMVRPQDDLEGATDVLKVPSAPVIHLALALLARERGETGGTSTAEYFQIADKYLRDAISVEAARHEDELIYYTV